MTTGAARKSLERIALALRIDRSIGAEEMAPCDYCQRHRRRCVVDSSVSTRCSECVRHKLNRCNYTSKLPSMNDWSSLDRQRQKLRNEEEEAMAKILRLRKQQRLLDDREKEMVRRGCETLDELDAAEASEKVMLEEQLARSRTLAEASSFFDDPTLDPEAFADLPDRFWAHLGDPPSSDVPSGGASGSMVSGAEIPSGVPSVGVFGGTDQSDPGS